MATIYLHHPRHGTKVAISDEEAKADEKQGWERYDLSASAEPVGNALAPQVVEIRQKRTYNKRKAA